MAKDQTHIISHPKGSCFYTLETATIECRGGPFARVITDDGRNIITHQQSLKARTLRSLCRRPAMPRRSLLIIQLIETGRRDEMRQYRHHMSSIITSASAPPLNARSGMLQVELPLGLVHFQVALLQTTLLLLAFLLDAGVSFLLFLQEQLVIDSQVKLPPPSA